MPIRVTITLLSTVILLAMCTPADAGQVASVYTKLDLDKCKLESSNPNEGGSAQWRCKGYNGMCARPGGDSRTFVSFGPGSANQATIRAECMPIAL